MPAEGLPTSIDSHHSLGATRRPLIPVNDNHLTWVNPSPPGLLAHPWVPGGGGGSRPLLSHEPLVAEESRARRNNNIIIEHNNIIYSLLSCVKQLNPISGRLLATPISGKGGLFRTPPPLRSPVLTGRFLKFKRHSFHLSMIYISKKRKFKNL